MEQSQQQFIKMTQSPIPRLITTLAVPTIISMLTTAIYNMADTFFVSKLGTSATGAVGIVFSLMAIIQAIGFTLGMGSGSLSSRLLGQQENQKANEAGSTAFFTAIAFGLLLTVFGLLFIDGLMELLGATETILPFARDYARFILLGAPVMCASFVLNNLLRAEGKAVLSMVGLTLGGVFNIILDPIFIFLLNMGIAGAAVATLLSQCISFCILLFCFLSKKTIIQLHYKNISRHLKTYLTILKTGMPSFCRQGLASASTVALNVNAAVYGDAAVAAMSIIGRIFLFMLSFMIGFGQGFQPVAGYNYGAKRFDRVKQAYWFALKVGILVFTVLAAAGYFAAPWAIGLFQKEDPEVMRIGIYAFRVQCLALPLQPLIVTSNMVLQSVGKSWQATFLSAARQGIFFLPLIFVMPALFGLNGVQLTQPLADVFTFVSCFPFMIRFFRELNQKIPKQQPVS